LDHGADVNADEGAALRVAAIADQTNTVAFLLEHGANPNIKDHHTDSPVLMVMVDAGKIEIIKLLLANGADVNIENTDGISALDIAKEAKRDDIVRLLQQAGATTSSASARVKADEAALQKIIDRANSRSDFEILGLNAKVVETSGSWWKWSYQFTARNNTDAPIIEFPRLQFLDAQGFIIDSATCEVKLKAGETATFRDTALVDLPGAARVKRIKFE
jgi:hypothetical protein